MGLGLWIMQLRVHVVSLGTDARAQTQMLKFPVILASMRLALNIDAHRALLDFPVLWAQILVHRVKLALIH
jgi:hypothetical protein